MVERDNSRVVNAWCMYDWANSVYSLVITTTIFPIYYSTVTVDAFGSDTVSFFNLKVSNTVLYSYSLSASFLVVAMLSPILSGIADSGNMRKFFMKVFTYLGSMSCIMLFFFTGKNIEVGIFFAAMASVGFAGSLVFYNSYLPVIASPSRYDIVSARGFSMGYVGSVILLVANLLMISKPEWFGLSGSTLASRISFVMVGFWWMGFAQITFINLPTDTPGFILNKKAIFNGYKRIIRVVSSLKKYPSLLRFLIAFFLYNTGVQTVLYLAALFGDSELGLEASELIITILLIQIVAIGGSYLFAGLSKWQGNKFSLMSMVVIWILICSYAYFIQTSYQFYALGFAVGLVMGGIQSLSRASYSKLIPKNPGSVTSYFSFYDVIEKVSIVFGTFAYGMVEQLTGSMRNSTITLTIFFISGLFVLSTVYFPPDKSRK